MSSQVQICEKMRPQMIVELKSCDFCYCHCFCCRKFEAFLSKLKINSCRLQESIRLSWNEKHSKNEKFNFDFFFISGPAKRDVWMTCFWSAACLSWPRKTGFWRRRSGECLTATESAPRRSSLASPSTEFWHRCRRTNRSWRSAIDRLRPHDATCLTLITTPQTRGTTTTTTTTKARPRSSDRSSRFLTQLRPRRTGGHQPHLRLASAAARQKQKTTSGVARQRRTTHRSLRLPAVKKLTTGAHWTWPAAAVTAAMPDSKPALGQRQTTRERRRTRSARVPRRLRRSPATHRWTRWATSCPTSSGSSIPLTSIKSQTKIPDKRFPRFLKIIFVEIFNYFLMIWLECLFVPPYLIECVI